MGREAIIENLTENLLGVKMEELQRRWDEVYQELKLEELPWETIEPDEVLAELIESEKVVKGNVLDICCGAGTQSIYMSKNGFKVVGIDISPTAIKLARKRAKKVDAEVNFVIGNSFQLPFDEKSFDFVFDRGCFHHVPVGYREDYINGVYRALKTKGKFYLSCFSQRTEFANSFTESQIRNYFSKFFKIKSIEEKVFIERGTGEPRYLYSVFMSKSKILNPLVSRVTL